MTVLSKVAKPFTPVMRRFFTDVFKPSTATTLGKRGRADDHTEQAPNCVALQNDDLDEDVVVITALNVIPFCCHADLMTMNREELIRVADTLNDKLPHAMRIDTSAPRSNVFIRNSVEILVGIYRPVPPAPKPNRSMSFVALLNTTPTQDNYGLVPPSPASPLANRSNRMNSASFVQGSALSAVDEKEEDDEAMEKHVKKRRRLVLDSDIMQATPSPTTRALLGRSQSQRTPRSNINSPFHMGPTQVFRSQSQKLPRRAPANLYRNVTLNRGRRGSAYNRFSSGDAQNVPILTSTPKKRKRGTDTAGSDSSASYLSSVIFPSPPAPSPASDQMKVVKKRKASQMDNATADVTAGIEGMSMADEGSGSDMEISFG